MIALSLLSFILATAVLAAPSRRNDTSHDHCKVPAWAVTLPSSFDPLPYSPKLVLMGVGVQNYTCNSHGIFDPVGVYAQMYDISCLYGTPELSTIQYDAFDDWSDYWSSDPFEPGFSQLLKRHYGITVDGEYYFVKENGSLIPVWDLRTYAGNPNAIVYAQKVKSVPSPDGPDNVDWVELKKLSGGLANVIYRVDTVQGRPPSTCTPGSYASVKYTANYLFV